MVNLAASRAHDRRGDLIGAASPPGPPHDRLLLVTGLDL